MRYRGLRVSLEGQPVQKENKEVKLIKIMQLIHVRGTLTKQNIL